VQTLLDDPPLPELHHNHQILVGFRRNPEKYRAMGLQAQEEVAACRPVIRLKRIYNFLCSMLVFTPFA
jgi:hypothetical protein